MIRRVTLHFLAALLVIVFGASWSALAKKQPDQSPPRPEPKTIFSCHEHQGSFGGDSGVLDIYKTFYEDGTVQSMTVRWEDDGGSFIIPSNATGHGSAALVWPGDYRIGRSPERLDWAHGSISVHYYTNGQHADKLAKKERWSQVIIDRSLSQFVYEQDGIRMLFGNGLDMTLKSELNSSGGLHMSLDTLLAWGMNLERLKVYETRAIPRKLGPTTQSNSPLGRMRIAGEYEIDVPKLTRKKDQVQDAVTKWEASLGDFKSKCQREVEVTDEEIIVT